MTLSAIFWQSNLLFVFVFCFFVCFFFLSAGQFLPDSNFAQNEFLAAWWWWTPSVVLMMNDRLNTKRFSCCCRATTAATTPSAQQEEKKITTMTLILHSTIMTGPNWFRLLSSTRSYSCLASREMVNIGTAFINIISGSFDCIIPIIMTISKISFSN